MKKKSSDGGFSKAQYKITGAAPLLLHNGQTADPLNDFAKKLKAVTSKRAKTDADHEEIARIEWFAGLYTNKDKKVILPAKNLHACLIQGAKKSKLGNQFKAGAFVLEDAQLIFADMDKTASELWETALYVDRSPVSVGQATCIRTRPRFEEWSATVSVEFNEELVDEAQITKALQDAGIQCGLGDWVPQHGRFRVQKV